MARYHVMVDPLPALYVDAVTYSETDSQRQEDLHRQDQIAQWFVIWNENSESRPPLLCRTDRFRELCNPRIVDNGWSSQVFPGFVSFIGDTGMGKSTILRAMILMGLMSSNNFDTGYESNRAELETCEEDQATRKIREFSGILGTRAAFPVARISNIDFMNDLMTYGVHLYKDRASVKSQHIDVERKIHHRETPILFADCEGFRAGVQKSGGERISHSSWHNSRRSQNGSSRGLPYESEMSTASNALHAQPVDRTRPSASPEPPKERHF